MASGAHGGRRMRSELRAAIDQEARRLDLLVARVWQVCSLLGLVGALVVAATMSRRLGFGAAGLSVVVFAWFSLVGLLLVNDRGGRALALASTVLESVMPTIFLALLLALQGPAYALGSWVPPLIFAAVEVAQIMRLRSLTPLIVGITSSLGFIAFYFLAIRGALSPELLAEPLNRPGTQITRAITLALAGAICSLVTRGLQGLIGRAESSARAQDLFGKYRVLRQIASGGMGTVHEALYCPEGGFERRVAIKRVHPHLAEQEKFVNEFRHEAELCARLVHPNIVQVFDFGRVENTYFLAMEYVEGLTLLGFMRRFFNVHRALPVGVVAHLGREILRGLDYSHVGARSSNGTPLRIIHRDLSPANVLVARTGEVKISDFGLARALRDAASTRTRTVAGHVAYMAPEQARGEPLDERCDLFAVGVVLWELLAGRRLFARDNESATLFALVMEPVTPISAARPELDPGWDRLFERALARETAARFESAREMGEMLEAICPSEGKKDVDALRQLVEDALRSPDKVVHDESETVPLPADARLV